MFTTRGVNHVNNGGQDDGVGNREAPTCKNMTGNDLCGDSLSFCPALGFAPYFNSTMARYNGSAQAWATNAIERIKSWNFNTIRGWSATIAEKEAGKQGLMYAHLLDLGTTWLNHEGFDHDVYSEDFVVQAEEIAAREVPPRANDTALLGFATDNEPYWDSVALAPYLDRCPSSPGCTAALTLLQNKYQTISNLNSAWNIHASSWNDVPAAYNASGNSLNKAAFAIDSDAFLEQSARRYFNVCSAAIRKHDTNHLRLGVRNSNPPTPVLKAMLDVDGTPLVDIVDIHGYGTTPPTTFDLAHSITGLPVLTGEFSFTAIDSNCPNTHGARANNPFATQSERAAAFLVYATANLQRPYSLGFHWWQFVDEPALGRFPDGEDSNYGLVNLADDPYEVLTQTMTEFNANADAMHASSYKAPLRQFYSASRNDHFLTITDCFECDGDYVELPLNSNISRIQSNDSSLQLSLYYNSKIADNCVSTSAPTEPGYDFIRIVGYLSPSATSSATIPVNLYHNDKDYYTTASNEEEQDAKQKGYNFVKSLGFTI